MELVRHPIIASSNRRSHSGIAILITLTRNPDRKHMKKLILTLTGVVAVALTETGVNAGTIVSSLNDGDALQTFGTSSALATNTSETLANGLTLAIDYTPTVGDIGASEAPAPVLLLEIGNSGAGSGIYLVNGGYWFVSKQGGNANYAAVDGSGFPTLDLDGTTGPGTQGTAISVFLGTAVAGTDAQVWASLDSVNGMFYGSVNGVQISDALTGVSDTWNWAGDGTLSFLQATTGAYGGAAVNGAAGVWKKAGFTSATGSAGDNDVSIGGQYFNEVIPVPEPSASALILLGITGFAGLAMRRRQA